MVRQPSSIVAENDAARTRRMSDVISTFSRHGLKSSRDLREVDPNLDLIDGDKQALHGILRYGMTISCSE